VNAPAWDLSRLPGLYVVFFFVIAQLVSWLGFKQPPSPRINGRIPDPELGVIIAVKKNNAMNQDVAARASLPVRPAPGLLKFRLKHNESRRNVRA
jgi:hypothetical protein